MRVLIDATPLLLRSAGVKTYVFHWTRALRAAAGKHSLDLFPYSGHVTEWAHERSVLPMCATLARLALLHAANGSPFPILNAIGSRVDIFHSSHQLLRPPRNTRVTATLYDMTCWLQPETHTPANVAMAKRFGRSVLTRAAGLIAISESTKADTIRVLGLASERIEVIYPGVSDAFFGARPTARK